MKALNVLDNALDKGDTKVALGLLKLRAADPSPTGTTDFHRALLELAQRLQIDLLMKSLSVDENSPVLQSLKARWMRTESGSGEDS